MNKSETTKNQKNYSKMTTGEEIFKKQNMSLEQYSRIHYFGYISWTSEQFLLVVKLICFCINRFTKQFPPVFSIVVVLLYMYEYISKEHIVVKQLPSNLKDRWWKYTPYLNIIRHQILQAMLCYMVTI